MDNIVVLARTATQLAKLHLVQRKQFFGQEILFVQETICVQEKVRQIKARVLTCAHRRMGLRARVHLSLMPLLLTQDVYAERQSTFEQHDKTLPLC